MPEPTPLLVARSSSHYSRVVRLFACELNIPVEFKPALNLLSTRIDDYGGNPSLKVPTLQLGAERVFGTLNICRRLWSLSGSERSVIWPEDMQSTLLSNALEVALNGMDSEVPLVMHRVAQRALEPAQRGAEPPHKPLLSLKGSLAWLEQQSPNLLEALRQGGQLSYLEVCLFCFIDHVQWREVLEIGGYPRLCAFRDAFAERASARATAYHFDA